MEHNTDYIVEDSLVNSIIGEGTTLRGEFDLNGLLRIDGNFVGKVRTTGRVLIGKNGTAECTIVSGTVVIGGKVKGDIIASEKITLLSTGELIGNIKTPRLIIEEGVIFDGTCEIIEDKERMIKIQQEFMEKHSLSDKLPHRDNIDNSSLKQTMKAPGESSLSVKTVP
jgi:cytoskeletal protein CcmA (bactofilin family)